MFTYLPSFLEQTTKCTVGLLTKPVKVLYCVVLNQLITPSPRRGRIPDYMSVTAHTVPNKDIYESTARAASSERKRLDFSPVGMYALLRLKQIFRSEKLPLLRRRSASGSCQLATLRVRQHRNVLFTRVAAYRFKWDAGLNGIVASLGISVCEPTGFYKTNHLDLPIPFKTFELFSGKFT